MSARQWNGLIEEMLTLIFEMHLPKWFMFDGAFPYRGMLNAIQAQVGMEKLWMQRGTLKKNKKIPAGTTDLFDTIIRPQDVDLINPPKINMLTREIFVPPITLIEPPEMLERNQARAALSVPQDCKLVYVQLGAGRINDITSTVRIVIDELLANPGVHVVLGESLLGERTMLGKERLHVIRDYPNALFFKAFDASVQAGGYNSFHEMRSIRLPTLFIPNTKTGMDDQLKRVMLSVEEGWGVVVEENPTEITEGLGELLRKESSGFEPTPNGATETANSILYSQEDEKLDK
jgi:UDP:flavonoid glycosyltransferase YjiC (YdhE family)